MKSNGAETIKSRKGISAMKRKPDKDLLYEALFTLNQQFGQVSETLERLSRLPSFRQRLRRRFIRASEAAVKETRAWANFELMHSLLNQEERDWARFGRLRRQLQEANDVLDEAERDTGVVE
jgi:hypothetical protein